MRTAANIIVAIVLFGVSAPSALATEPFAKVGTITTTVFDFARGVRNEGMGATGVADPSRPANTVYNPANIVGADGFFAFYQHDDFLNLISVHDVGVSFARTTGDSSFQYGIGVRHARQDYEPIVMRTVFLPEGTGQTYDPDDYYTAFTLAGGVNRGNMRVAVGTAAKVLRLDFAGDDASGWVFDFGARVDWRLEGERGDVANLRVGASALGFEHDIESRGYTIGVADQLRLGGGVDYATSARITSPFSKRAVPVASLALNLDYVHRDRTHGDKDGYGLGVEVGVAEVLYLRVGGVNTVPGHSDGATWGVGIAAAAGDFRARLDVAGYSLDNWLIESDDDIIYGVAVDYSP